MAELPRPLRLPLAIANARSLHSDRTVEIEVENLQQLNEALHANADIIMLDNFTPTEMTTAVQHVRTATANRLEGPIKLEASGNITDATLLPYARTGVDYISIGALTKDCKAIDLSMRITL